MNALADDARDRLVRFDVELRLGLADPAAVVWFACELLVAGVDSPALAELAGEAPDRLTQTDAEPLVRRVLAELGVDPASPERASWLLVRHAARRMLAGDRSAGRTLFRLDVDHDPAPDLRPLADLLWRWEVDWCDEYGADVDRELAEQALRLAEERLR